MFLVQWIWEFRRCANPSTAASEEQELLEGSGRLLTKQEWQGSYWCCFWPLVKEAARSRSLFLGSLSHSWLVLSLSWSSNLRQARRCSFGLPPLMMLLATACSILLNPHHAHIYPSLFTLFTALFAHRWLNLCKLEARLMVPVASLCLR